MKKGYASFTLEVFDKKFTTEDVVVNRITFSSGEKKDRREKIRNRIYHMIAREHHTVPELLLEQRAKEVTKTKYKGHLKSVLLNPFGENSRVIDNFDSFGKGLFQGNVPTSIIIDARKTKPEK